MEIFSYQFMIRAFVAGILLAIIIPSIGMVVVLRRLSMIGESLSHTSLAGVALGLVLGINPVAGAIAMSVLAALCIELMRRKFPHYQEISLSIILSAGIGITGILSGYGNTANLGSYMFGSIVAISNFDLVCIVTISVVVIAAMVFLYQELFLVSLDEQAARLSGVPVATINMIFTVLTALTVAIASRTVGALVVSSLMVIPVACGMQTAKSYRGTLLASILFALLFTIFGLFASFYWGFRPGGAIVLTGVLVLVFLLVVKPNNKPIG